MRSSSSGRCAPPHRVSAPSACSTASPTSARGDARCDGLEIGALAAALVVALSTAVVLVRDDNQTARGGRARRARDRRRRGRSRRRPASARAPVPIALDPDQGYVRGPLVVSGSTLSLAAYDHDGDRFTFPPSRIVRLDDRTFREQGRTDLKAEILSIADGDGARWVVTRNPKPPNGLPDAFLKRIGADGAVGSKLLPFGSDPVGDVAVGAGACGYRARRRAPIRRGDVAVRVQDALAPAERRAVAVVNGTVLVTDGSRIRTLEGTNVAPGGFVLGDSGAELIGLAGAGDTLWALSSAPNGSTALLVGVPPVRKIELPARFVPARSALRRQGLGRGNRRRRRRRSCSSTAPRSVRRSCSTGAATRRSPG